MHFSDSNHEVTETQSKEQNTKGKENKLHVNKAKSTTIEYLRFIH